MSAIVWQSENAVLEGFLHERGNLEVIDFGIGLLQPSGDLLAVGGSPPIIFLTSVLLPLVVLDPVQFLRPQIGPPLKPGRLQNSAAMLTITAVAAIPFLWVDEIPLVVDGDVGAGGGDVGHDGRAEEFIPPTDSVHPVPVVSCVVEDLGLGVFLGAILQVDGFWKL